MPDNNLPKSVGETVSPPSSLTPKQEELCKRLDRFYARHNLTVKSSDMFKGAIFVMKVELRSNPDWMAQAANSLREILYPFNGKEDLPKQKEALKQFGSVRVDGKQGEELFRVFGSLSELTHHGNGRGSSVDYSTFTSEDFENLVSRFENVMFDVLARQLDVHKEIDDILAEVSASAVVAEANGEGEV